MRNLSMLCCSILCLAGLWQVLTADFIVGSTMLIFGGLVFIIIAPRTKKVTEGEQYCNKCLLDAGYPTNTPDNKFCNQCGKNL